MSCVSFAPPHTRPLHSPADGDSEDVLRVLSIGPSFKYVIPSFDVLAVSMRPMVIRIYYDGEERTYDIFVRSDSCLNGRVFPAVMRVKDYALIEVSHYQLLHTQYAQV